MKTVLIAAIAMVLAPFAPALARPFTPKDMISLSRIAEPTISPDGHWLVWSQRETDLAANDVRTTLWRLDLQHRGAAPEPIAATAHAAPSHPAFGPGGDLFFLAERDGGKSAVWRISMAKGGPVRVTDEYGLSGFKVSPKGDEILVWADRPVGARSLDDTIAPKPADQGSARIYDQLFVRHWNRWADGQRSQLFVMPLIDGHAVGPGHAIEGTLIGDTPSKPAGDSDEVSWSQDGRTVYFTLLEAGRIEPLSANADIFAVSAKGSQAPANLTAQNLALDTTPAPSPDGRWLAWKATRRPGYENDRQVIMLRDLATGQVRALTAGWDRSIDAIAWAADSAALYVTADDTLDHPLFQVSVVDGAVKRLTGAGHVTDVRPLPQGGVVYALDSLTFPTDFWRRDENDRTTRLTSINAARLADIDWPSLVRFSFKGADEDTVWGFALRPANLPPSVRAPGVLLVHGGPQNTFNDSWSFRWNPALWADHGYAVISIDFHGSTGYGQAFTDSIIRDWGGKPLTDLKLGLKAATERFDFLDASRMCAAGGSYGGYMMNWIEGHWPDRFKCLVQHDGIFDQRAMTYETDDLVADEWDFGARPYFEAPGEFEKWNPVNAVVQWKTPQLVITSNNDFRSPDTQAVAAFTALQLRDVSSRLLVFPDEGHVINKPKNILQWYNEVFKWMDRWTRQQALPKL